MKKQILFLLIFLAFGASLNRANAQTVVTSTDRAFYNLKESVSELVAAKDKNDKNSLAYRIYAFKQVMDLSIAEADEVRSKLIAITPLENENEWYKKTLEVLTNSSNYFKERRKTFNGLQIKNIDEIRVIAEKFKEWRGTNYLEAVEGATDYISLKEAEEALLIATARRVRIGVDLDSIPVLTSPSKARVVGELSNLYLKSRDVISNGQKERQEAYKLFTQKYLTNDVATTSPTSTEPVTQVTEGSSTATSSLAVENSTTSQDTAPDSSQNQTSTESGVVSVQNTPLLTVQLQASIKDLVRNSLASVRESYQIFIEMSRVVRTLL